MQAPTLRAHLIRELTFLVESNQYRWARLMNTLLQEACHQLNRSQAKVLSAAACKALRQRYRSILTQGAKEVPAIPPRTKGQRGRLAKSAAHNLHERLAKHEASVLRFLHDPQVSFTNNAGERGLRMAKVKSRSQAAFERRPTARPMRASPATCSRWPRSATILSSPSKSRAPATLSTRSSNTMARYLQTPSSYAGFIMPHAIAAAKLGRSD